MPRAQALGLTPDASERGLRLPPEADKEVQIQMTILEGKYVTVKGTPIDPAIVPQDLKMAFPNPAVLQLVRLDELLTLDPSIEQVAQLPVGFCARRQSAQHACVFKPEQT